MRKKRLLFLLSSLCVGGAEKHTIELINRLDASRMDLYLGCIERREDLLPELNIRKLQGFFTFDKRARVDLRVASRIIRTIQGIRPDKVVCVNLYPAFYVGLVRFLKKLQVVQIIHSTIKRNRYEDAIVRLLYRHLINRSDQVVFVARRQMHYWLRHYGIKTHISRYIHNGVDCDFFDGARFSGTAEQLRHSLGLHDHETVIGICATLRPEKRHTDLIDACGILVREGIALKIMMVGDGPERERIMRHIHARRMDGQVVLTGFQRDVRPFLAGMDILVVSSSTETLPMSVLEAMAMGKPIVASALGGIPEQVWPGCNGFLFNPLDVRGLAHCLKEAIVSNDIKRMGKQSREIAKSHFGIQGMVKQYEELLLA